MFGSNVFSSLESGGLVQNSYEMLKSNLRSGSNNGNYVGSASGDPQTLGQTLFGREQN